MAPAWPSLCLPNWRLRPLYEDREAIQVKPASSRDFWGRPMVSVRVTKGFKRVSILLFIIQHGHQAIEARRGDPAPLTVEETEDIALFAESVPGKISE